MSRGLGDVYKRQPLRLTTMRMAFSTVVKRPAQSEHSRRRRIADPPSITRESSTLDCSWWQNGQCMRSILPRASSPAAATAARDLAHGCCGDPRGRVCNLIRRIAGEGTARRRPENQGKTEGRTHEQASPIFVASFEHVGILRTCANSAGVYAFRVSMHLSLIHI